LWEESICSFADKVLIILVVIVSRKDGFVMMRKMLGWSFVLALVASVFVGCEAGGPKVAIRVNCAATEAYIDTAGNAWLPDQMMEAEKEWGATEGLTIDRGELAITGVPAPKVYETERYSMTAYEFTVPEGTYTVRLHFAETFDGITAAGERIFNVSINDNVVLKDLDVYKEGGGLNKPVVKEIQGIKAAEGKIVIGFESNIQNSEINGIEILS
jgi:Malectin domain